MTNTTDYYRVTIHIAGTNTPIELLSAGEPRRLDNGEIQANWVDARGVIVGHINWSLVAAVTWKQVKPAGVA